MANDKPNVPPSTPSPSPADPVKAAASASASAAVEAMLPTIAAMMAQGQGGPAPKYRPPQDPGPRCPTCGQYLKACGGPPPEGKEDVNHSWISVFPKGIAAQAEFSEWFTGVTLNGVRYLSAEPGHRIPVPKVAEADIIAMIERWSEEEILARTGRKVKVSRYNPVTRGDAATSYV